MRLSRAGGCLAVAGVYVILRITIPMLRVAHLNGILMVVMSIALMMLVQLALAVSIAGLGMKPKTSALWALGSAVVFAGFLLMFSSTSPAVPKVVARGLVAIQQLSLMSLAAFLGCTVSHIVREPNLLLPVAMVAALVDYWNVNLGPLGHFIENKPSVVSAVAVHMPSPVPGIPAMMVGMGDFVFLAMYFAILFRFGMNVRGTFWLGYVVLTASMLFVLKAGVLPALIPMGIVVIVANARHFKLSREEKVAVLYAAVLVLVLFAASGIFLSRR